MKVNSGALNLIPQFLTQLKFASDFGLSSQTISCLQQSLQAEARVVLKALFFMVSERLSLLVRVL